MITTLQDVITENQSIHGLKSAMGKATEDNGGSSLHGSHKKFLIYLIEKINHRKKR